MSSLTYYIEYHYAGRLHPFGFRLPVNDDVALLGRDPQATVRFYYDTPTVSRRHRPPTPPCSTGSGFSVRQCCAAATR